MTVTLVDVIGLALNLVMLVIRLSILVVVLTFKSLVVLTRLTLWIFASFAPLLSVRRS